MTVRSLHNTLKFILGHPLNRDRRVTALLRWLWWQLSCRVAPGARVVGFVSGASLLVERGMTGATGNIYTGLQDFEEMSFLLHYLRDSDDFIDVGANVGTYTVLASAVCGSRSISIEPIPKTFQHLLDNISVNGISDKVKALNIGAGSKKGRLRFIGDSGAKNRVALDNDDPTQNTVEVGVDTIDSIVGERSPAFMKVDVEGYETEVIRGADKTLKRGSLHAVLVELNGCGEHYGFSDRELNEMMLSYGFRRYDYNPYERKLMADPDIGSRQNALYLRSLEFVTERLEKAPVFKVFGKNI